MITIIWYDAQGKRQEKPYWSICDALSFMHHVNGAAIMRVGWTYILEKNKGESAFHLHRDLCGGLHD